MANPKDKWSRPLAPPAPMFFGEKERNLVKQINDELSERVLGQTVAYYPISIEESNFNDTYGEAKEKVSLPPVCKSAPGRISDHTVIGQRRLTRSDLR